MNSVLLYENFHVNDQSSHRLEKYLNLESFLEKSLKIKSALKSTLGLPQSGKKFWKMKKFPGQGKVRELHFQSGKFEKNEKSQGISNFPKKMLVNRLLEILVSIICKQY